MPGRPQFFELLDANIPIPSSRVNHVNHFSERGVAAIEVQSQTEQVFRQMFFHFKGVKSSSVQILPRVRISLKSVFNFASSSSLTGRRCRMTNVSRS